MTYVFNLYGIQSNYYSSLKYMGYIYIFLLAILVMLHVTRILRIEQCTVINVQDTVYDPLVGLIDLIF